MNISLLRCNHSISQSIVSFKSKSGNNINSFGSQLNRPDIPPSETEDLVSSLVLSPAVWAKHEHHSIFRQFITTNKYIIIILYFFIFAIYLLYFRSLGLYKFR